MMYSKKTGWQNWWLRAHVSCQGGDRIIAIFVDVMESKMAAEALRLFMKGFGKNTGPGLFLSREILAITGISITETGEPGSGARFEIRVPEGESRYLENPGESLCDIPARNNTIPSHSIINIPE
jgi:hypothetical protein